MSPAAAMVTVSPVDGLVEAVDPRTDSIGVGLAVGRPVGFDV